VKREAPVIKYNDWMGIGSEDDGKKGWGQASSSDEGNYQDAFQKD
jgi:hypothetical protein